jgi:hypothetical protein
VMLVKQKSMSILGIVRRVGDHSTNDAVRGLVAQGMSQLEHGGWCNTYVVVRCIHTVGCSQSNTRRRRVTTYLCPDWGMVMSLCIQDTFVNSCE